MNAVGFTSIFRQRVLATKGVDPWRYWLKMRGIDATRVAAKVVYMQPVWDRRDEHLVCVPMHLHMVAMNHELSVTGRAPSPGPIPAFI
jgi:hypothetical protein